VTRYELLDRVGVGGMAEIFRGKAIAAGGFEKPVAIKRILPHLSQDRRFVELLIAEAKVLSVLRHRNIVQIFDVGLGDDGQYFLVMEFVDGADLGVLQRTLEARRWRLPFDLALHVGADICEALEYAHGARGPDGKPMMLVHRDVTPSNVLVSRAGEVKLTDFGIAKRAEEVTGHGAVRGKFAYISPEQARNEHLDSRSDVFSVAILVWELVTGQRLFSHLPDIEALRAVREAAIPAPSTRDPTLPAAVDQLLLKALARDPDRRFASAGEFGAKLRALRYALDETTGDPATELAKILDGAEPEAAPPPRRPAARPEPSEATVIRIQTADAFSQKDADGTALLRARQVIDRFDEAETRMATLSAAQLDQLRAGEVAEPPGRDSTELTVARPSAPVLPRGFVAPPRAAPSRSFDDEATTMEPSRVFDDEATAMKPARAFDDVPGRTPSRAFDDEATVMSGAPPMAAILDEVSDDETRQVVARLPAVTAVRPPPRPAGPSAPPPLPPPRPPAPILTGPTPIPTWALPPSIPRAASPTMPEAFDRPLPPPPVAAPHVAGFGRPRFTARPWHLVLAGAVVAALAFGLTRACADHGTSDAPSHPSSPAP
jgi:serine/threonine-protein kinase